jgi:hypothetical protein
MAKRGSAAAAVVTADVAGAVAERAYFKALGRGFTPGHELDDWLAAEREVAALLASTEPPVRRSPARGKPAVASNSATPVKKRKPAR